MYHLELNKTLVNTHTHTHTHTHTQNHPNYDNIKQSTILPK